MAALYPVFVKPFLNTKRFTGKVVVVVVDDDEYDYQLLSVSRAEMVWISEVVKFEAECRCYVLNGELYAVSWYAGSRSRTIDMETVLGAISNLSESGYPVCSCALDFGVSADGKTLLIEANDAFSLGCYEGGTAF
jgi:hypothetical protein